MDNPITSPTQDPSEPLNSMDIDDASEPQFSDTDLEPLSQPTPVLDQFEISPEEEKALIEHDMSEPNPSRLSSLQKSLPANTVQPNIKRFFATKTSANIPSVPEISQASAVNVQDLTSSTDLTKPVSSSRNLSTPPTLQEQNSVSSKIPIRTISKREITCRFKIRISGGVCNLPLLIKQVIKLYRGVDSSLSVLPIQSPYEDSLILDHEDLIPETEEELNQWVTCVVPHYERIHFTMRFSLTKSLSSLSGPIFSWMKLNRSYVKMDSIKSEKIVTLGFFEGFHPDFQTRDTFKNYCYKHIKSRNSQLSSFTMDDFSVYPRAVYVGETVNKVTTRAMVIEVGADHSSSVLTSLSASFSDMYSDVTFIPFTKVDDDYKVLLKMAMLKQNKLLHSLKRKQIRGLVRPHTLLQKKDGQQISLCQWLQSARNEQDPNTRIIKSVEETKYNTSILYLEPHAEQVSELCKNLKENMAQHFPPSSLEVVFTTSYSNMPNNFSRIISQEEATWASIIKRKYLPNPADDFIQAINIPTNPPNKFRKSVYYGTTKKPSPLREDTHVQENASTAETETISSLQSELSMRYHDLEQKLQTFMQSQDSINNDTRTYVDNSIATMEENLNLRIQQNTDTIQNQISTLESNHNNQFSILAQTLNSVAGNVNALLDNFNSNTSSSVNSVSTTITTQESVSDSGKH